MKKMCERTIVAILATVLVVLCKPINVSAATSYLGNDDNIDIYTNITNSNTINSINDLEYILYNRGYGINNFQLPVTSDMYPGDGEAFNAGDHIEMKLKSLGRANNQENVTVPIKTSINFSPYDLMIVEETNDKRTTTLGGYEGSHNYVLQSTGVKDSSGSAKYIVNYDITSFEKILERPYLRIAVTFNEEGQTRYNKVYGVKFEKGGTIIELDSNGGQQYSTKTFFVQQNDDDITFEQYKLDTKSLGLIPTKPNYTFCGWDVVQEQYTNTDPQPELHNYRFNSNGTILMTQVLNKRRYFRYHIKLKAHWEPNGNSKLNVITNGTTTSYTGKYLDTKTIAKPATITGWNIALNPNPIDGDTITNYSNKTTTRSFLRWKYNSIKGALDVNSGNTTYTFLGHSNQVSTIEAEYQDDYITLPTPYSKNGLAFCGWYSTPVPKLSGTNDADKYSNYLVALPGVPVQLHKSQTLYAGWIKLEIKYSKTGTTSDTRQEIGNIKWNTVAKDPSFNYRVYYTLDDEYVASDPLNKSAWHIKHKYGTDVNSINKLKSRTIAGTETFVAPSNGYYDITIISGKGGASASYSGGSSNKIITRIYCNRGDKFTYTVGGNGSQVTNNTITGGGYNGGGNAWGYLETHSVSRGHWDMYTSNHDFTAYTTEGAYINKYTAHGEKCGNDQHKQGTTKDWWNCGTCDAFEFVQCYDKDTGYGDGHGSNSNWGPSNYHQYKDVHKKALKAAGGGGGATELWLNGTLVLAAAGGNGASVNSGGASPSTSIYSSEQEWTNNKQGTHASTVGQGGGGAGRLKNYYKIIPGRMATAPTIQNTTENPGVWIRYTDLSVDDNNMNVESVDRAAPNAVNMNTLVIYDVNPSDRTKYTFAFNRPLDNGTNNYYFVSMDGKSDTLGTVIQKSNIEKVFVTSGTAGYYWVTDNKSNTTVTKSNTLAKYSGDGKTLDSITNAQVDNTHNYLHIAPVDFAGNLGPTTHYSIPIGVAVRFDPNDIGTTPKNINGYTYTTRPSGHVDAQILLPGYPAEKLHKGTFIRDGYIFTGWNTQPNGTGIHFDDEQVVSYSSMYPQVGYLTTLYAQWKPIEYDIYYHGNDNWNSQADYKQRAVFDTLPFTLQSSKFQRNTGQRGDYTSYSQIGWAYDSVSWTPKFNNNQQVTTNLSKVNGYILNVYAIWEKPLTLTFDLTGGKGEDKLEDATGKIKLTTKIYNSQYDYPFNLMKLQTPQKTNYYLQQTGKIDAYGTYDGNGLNSRYIKINSTNASEYRLLGWGKTISSVEPDDNLIVFEPSHPSTYTIHNNTTLYAIWEPVLYANINVNRTLGDALGNEYKYNNIQKMNAERGVYTLRTRIYPGEQGFYNIVRGDLNTLNRPNNLYIKTDYKKVFDLRDDPSAYWFDMLNPIDSSGECVEDSGLNRVITSTDSSTNRKFYMPMYIGKGDTDTNPPYNAKVYWTQFHIAQYSYYYKNYVPDADREEIEVNCYIYVTDSNIEDAPDDVNAGSDPWSNTVDRIRTRVNLQKK